MTYILSLIGITGHARRVLSHNVQTNLIKMGFTVWPMDDGKPANLEAKAILVNHPVFPQTIVMDTSTDKAITAPDGGCRVFDAADGSEDFIAACKRVRVVETWVNGVKVTITHDHIDVDPSQILEGVMKDAKARQQAIFG
jgi:hypothetical protein